MKPSPLSPERLDGILDEQIANARQYYDSERSGFRQKAIDYFEGEETLGGDVPPQANRSRVVSRDVSDVHGMIMPSLMRVFFSSDRVAIYEPTRQENEKFAKQATDLVNYVVMRECNGYRYFHDSISDGLLLGNGILKHWWDQEPVYRTESFTGLSEDAYKLLTQDKDIEEVLKETSYPDSSWVPPAMPPAMPAGMPAMPQGMPQGMPAGMPAGMPPMPGQPPMPGPQGDQPPMPDMPQGMPGGQMPQDMPPDTMGAPPVAPLLYDITVKRKIASGRLRISSIPYEEFLIEQSARELNEEDCRFCAHVRHRTRSSLIAEGYDPEIVNELPAYADTTTTQNRELRDSTVNYRDDGPDRSTDLIEVHECYVLVDADGDGIAERLRVVRAGVAGNRQTLYQEEWGDDLPFSDIVPDPRPYAWRGYGLYDLLSDVQRVKTVLIRALLDNSYWVTNPQRIGVQNQIDNPDEVASPTFGGVIWAKSPDALQILQQPYIVDKLAPVLDYQDSITERRTGISKQSQAMDLDALQNQTATATNVAQSAAFSRVEEYARNIAECGGFKRAFKCILKLIVKHQDRPKTIRLRGEWVDMDPRAWDADMDVTINTGLGAGSRDRDLAALGNIAMKQEQAIQMGGPSNPLAPLDKYANTLIKMCEASGIKSPEQFFNEVTSDQVAEIGKQGSPPDPKIMELQMKGQMQTQQLQMQGQLEQQKLAMQSQHEQARAQADAAQEQAKLDRQAMVEERQAQADIAVRQQEMQARMQLEREKAANALAIQQQQFEFDKEMRLREFQHKQQMDVHSAALRQQQQPMQAM